VKLMSETEMVHVNGKKVGGNDAVTKFTAYVSPYFVVSNGGAYTKHIYAASQRIASKLGNEDGFGADPRRVEQAGGKKYSDIQKDNIGARFSELGFAYTAPEKEKVEKDSTMDSEEPENLVFYYHPDHLGSTSYVTDADGNIAQHVEYIPYGEVFVEERNNSFSTNFLFNAKELDNETGLYYYGARYLDPTGAMWLSVDPMWEKYAGMSPYNYCMGNPVKLVDPDGEDVVTVGEDGLTVKVEKQDGPNIFMDNNGNTLTFNDEEDVDKNKLVDKFNIGDRVYMPVNTQEACSDIQSVEQNDDIKKSRRTMRGILSNCILSVPYHTIKGYLSAIIASYSGCDFTFHFLRNYYNKNRTHGLYNDDRDLYVENGKEYDVYFRFEGSNSLYNLYDAGNFMWGAWTKEVGLAGYEVKAGSEINEAFLDSEADQRAIRAGRAWYNNKK